MNLKHFSAKEFTCDGVNCFDKMDVDTLHKLDTAREYANIPFTITSSWRSEEKNKAINGAKNSAHLRGYAIDIACESSIDRFIILDALICVGFRRIGIAKTFIHADSDPNLSEGVTWLY